MKKKVMAIIISIVLIVLIVVFAGVFTVKNMEEHYETAPLRVEQGTVIKVSGIDFRTNILAINENRTIRKIEEHFPDNSIEIINIERVFPNKVIFYIRERLPIMAVKVKNLGDSYALADIDFQLNKVVEGLEEGEEKFILITGVEVEGSFNTPIFSAIYHALQVLVELGYSPYDMPQMISEISFIENILSFHFYDGKVGWVDYTSPTLKADFRESFLSLNK